LRQFHPRISPEKQHFAQVGIVTPEATPCRETQLGESATELIHIGMMILDKGLMIDEFIEQVFNYPTLNETYKYAAYDGLGNLAGHKLREG
jgi:hypothetical protein